MPELRCTILGCGSSGGVPRLGGHWGDCDPENPPAFFWGVAPPDPAPLTQGNIKAFGHGTSTLAIVGACTIAIVHV